MKTDLICLSGKTLAAMVSPSSTSNSSSGIASDRRLNRPTRQSERQIASAHRALMKKRSMRQSANSAEASLMYGLGLIVLSVKHGLRPVNPT